MPVETAGQQGTARGFISRRTAGLLAEVGWAFANAQRTALGAAGMFEDASKDIAG
jgi:hypothetical protein